MKKMFLSCIICKNSVMPLHFISTRVSGRV